MKKYKTILAILVTILMATCSDPWDDRFDSDVLPASSVAEMIATNPDYVGFRELLAETGYDTILLRNTVFTVFLPVGNSFPALSSMSQEQKREIVASHISNGIFYAKDIADGSKLKTLSGKNMFFESEGHQMMINRDAIITRENILATNGVIHEISEPQTIRPNLLAYINQHHTYSHIADYFNDNTELIFDLDNSVPVGINEVGQTVYDTVWRKSNPFFNDMADISSEDFQYTMFLASNVLLDTADGGELKPGYLNGIGGFILEGMLDMPDLTEAMTAVDGSRLNIPELSFRELDRTSNGMTYELMSFDGVAIPKTFSWEVTSVADFDSIRNVRQVNYVNHLDLLKDITIYDVEGGFTAFSYAFDPRAVNTDYLRIQTIAGTYASIDFKLPDMAPGEYALSMNAMIRVNDGITFDVYLNHDLIKTGVSLNGGSFSFEYFDLGVFTSTEPSGNILTLKISGSNPAQRSGFIDYLLFVPVK